LTAGGTNKKIPLDSTEQIEYHPRLTTVCEKRKTEFVRKEQKTVGMYGINLTFN
jgi:hypothetical protein